jgi:serine/threonine protein kinase
MFRDKTREYIAKIGDFGCSIAENPSGAYLAGGTPPWTAPEWRSWIPTEELSKTDVYSFGLLVWRVMSGEHNPWKTILPSQTTSQSVIGRARIEELKRDADSLLRMLESNIRPTLSRSVQHAIIETLRHTVRLDPKERDLDITIALLLSVVEHDSERQTRSDHPRANLLENGID